MQKENRIGVETTEQRGETEGEKVSLEGRVEYREGEGNIKGEKAIQTGGRMQRGEKKGREKSECAWKGLTTVEERVKMERKMKNQGNNLQLVHVCYCAVQ